MTMPRNSPEISMVGTSESETLGSGPRWRGYSCPSSRSSAKQKTAMMKVGIHLRPPTKNTATGEGTTRARPAGALPVYGYAVDIGSQYRHN